MHAGVGHGTHSFKSLPKDCKVGCEVRPPMSSGKSLTPLERF